MERTGVGLLVLILFGLQIASPVFAQDPLEEDDFEYSEPEQPIQLAEEKDPKFDPDPATMTPEEEEESFLSAYSVEETRKNVSKRVFRLSNTIDSLFGDRRADDRRNKSTLRLGQRFWNKDGVTGGDNFEASLNLYLPNLKRIEKKVSDSVKNAFSDDKETKEGKAAGKEAPVEDERSRWDLNQESGFIVADPVDYFLRLRLRRDFFKGKFIHSFYEQIGWSKKNEWEERTSLASDYAITRNLLFRFVNEKDWAMTNEVFVTTHGPSLIHQLSEQSAISYDLRMVTGIESGLLYGDRASLGATYRTQLPTKWIFLEVNPVLAWERATRFRPLYNFFVKFEFVFGNI
ncbi:hypothetical protein [Bdellovibrio reynosensis]|uniref:DUF3078 domain-containing protein n=1 Tax=Bdellovibrio reynosensis TaxID=2835041 RepID=A0ABY4C5J9_9BACT|nr:hypothetical protein [Bdellovibrio reynosensis]UOF00168.1 hypothetical protein MNR06_10690 [Bdellovibrio reynosensis]